MVGVVSRMWSIKHWMCAVYVINCTHIDMYISLSCTREHFFRHSHCVPHKWGLFCSMVLRWCSPPKNHRKKPIDLPRIAMVSVAMPFMIHPWSIDAYGILRPLAVSLASTMAGLWRWDLRTSLPLRWHQWRQCCIMVATEVVKWSGNTKKTCGNGCSML